MHAYYIPLRIEITRPATTQKVTYKYCTIFDLLCKKMYNPCIQVKLATWSNLSSKSGTAGNNLVFKFCVAVLIILFSCTSVKSLKTL